MSERSEARDVEKEQELKSLFYDPMTGYQSRERLYQKAKDSGLNVSRREVKEWLETQETYTRHKPVVKKHKFQKTYVNDLADQIQLDLVDISKFSHKNQGYRNRWEFCLRWSANCGRFSSFHNFKCSNDFF